MEINVPAYGGQGHLFSPKVGDERTRFCFAFTERGAPNSQPRVPSHLCRHHTHTVQVPVSLGLQKTMGVYCISDVWGTFVEA